MCLIESNPDFSLEPYFPAIVTEFESLGIHVSIKENEKSIETSVDSAFLKAETIWKEIVLEDLIKQTGVRSNKTIKIKLEVDRNPPLQFSTEEKLLIRSFYIKCFTRSSLFAGKMHALLYRKWNGRVKGTDWYDLEWYIKKGIPLDVAHFLNRAKDTGAWTEPSITPEQIKQLLKDKIAEVSIDNVKEDVVRFIQDESTLKIWSPQYFNDLVDKLKFGNLPVQ